MILDVNYKNSMIFIIMAMNNLVFHDFRYSGAEFFKIKIFQIII